MEYVNYYTFRRLSSMLIALLYWWKFRPISIKWLSAFNFGAKLLIQYNTSVRVQDIQDKVYSIKVFLEKSILLFLSCKFCSTIKVCLFIWLKISPFHSLPYINYTYLQVYPKKLLQIVLSIFIEFFIILLGGAILGTECNNTTTLLKVLQPISDSQIRV